MSSNASMGSEEAVEIYGNGNVSTRGSVEVRHFTRRERVWRAIKIAIIMLMISLLSLFIPIVHFVLVPVLILLSIMLISRALNSVVVIAGGRGSCPNCGGIIAIYARRYKFPFEDVCEKCGRRLQIKQG